MQREGAAGPGLPEGPREAREEGLVTTADSQEHETEQVADFSKEQAYSCEMRVLIPPVGVVVGIAAESPPQSLEPKMTNTQHTLEKS